MDKLTPEQCQALIEQEHDWEQSYLVGRPKEIAGEHRTFKQATVTLWGEHYPAVLKERITKYETGDFCCKHKDNSWRDVRKNCIAQNVWITPLNDDYEGGELYFNDELIEQQVGVPIKMNRRIPHEVTEVTKGTRYSLVSWEFVKR